MLHNNLLYKMGHYFLDRQYASRAEVFTVNPNSALTSFHTQIEPELLYVKEVLTAIFI